MNIGALNMFAPPSFLLLSFPPLPLLNTLKETLVLYTCLPQRCQCHQTNMHRGGPYISHQLGTNTVQHYCAARRVHSPSRRPDTSDQ